VIDFHPPIVDIELARSQIQDESLTAYVVHGYLGESHRHHYFQELVDVYESSARTKIRPMSDDGDDCVQPWLYDHSLEKFMVNRMYLFLHNEIGTLRGKIHNEIMQTRDLIEADWPNQRLYTEKGYRSFHIVTKYESGADGYPRHTDVPFDYQYPMLQCWLQLTDPGHDFQGGDLVLHPPSGRSVSVIHDLGVRAGDLIFFDKRTEHEVTPCHHRDGGVGRWIVIVGAMAPLAMPIADRIQ
jgi:2OG-Fe(II) oxygenase superfamily